MSMQNISLFDPQTLIDPYEVYAQLRDEAPVFHAKELESARGDPLRSGAPRRSKTRRPTPAAMTIFSAPPAKRRWLRHPTTSGSSCWLWNAR